MPARIRPAATLAVLLLSGCELVVNPHVSPSGSTGLGTTVGNGSSAASSSGSTAGASSDSSASSSGSSASSSGSSAASSSSGSGATAGSSGASSGSGSGSGTGSSSGSSGSSGGPICPGPFGSTGSQGALCPSTPPTEATRAEFPLHHLADSISSCDGGNCLGRGDDADYRFGIEGICKVGQHTYTGGVTAQAIPFAQLPISTVNWQQTKTRGADVFANAQGYCSNNNWTGQNAGGTIALPTASQLVELLDFGSVGLVPPQFDAPGGLFWAGTQVGSSSLRWRVDFSTGGFALVDTNVVALGPTAQARCVDVAGSGGGTQVGLSCGAGAADGGRTCEMLAGTGGTSSPTTGLTYFLPDLTPSVSWSAALQTCATLDGTCGQWRLPSYKELAGLVNFTAVATGTPLDALSGTFWSSTVAPAAADQAMVIQFQQAGGSTTTPANVGASDAMVSAHQVLCVKGP